MKTRSIFVSNSSSSSFVVISKNDALIDHQFKADNEFEFCILGDTGNKEFGWERTEYHDFHDKLTWAALQALYQKVEGNDKYVKLLNEFIVGLGFREEHIIWEYLIGDFKIGKAYIDHQSTIYESPENAKIFESMDVLKRFLLNDESYIQGDNDNY